MSRIGSICGSVDWGKKKAVLLIHWVHVSLDTAGLEVMSIMLR